MSSRLNSTAVVSHIKRLAFGKANDAVKLAFIPPERLELIDELDLSMVSEVKRGAKGEVEVKLLNRVARLELLAKLLEGEAPRGSEAESFFTAMDKAAARLGDGK